MCLTIPGKIKSIKDGIATVENCDRSEQIELGIVINAKVGDWVLYATNRAVRLIDEQEAQEIIELLEDNYQPVDIKALPLEYKLIISKIRNPNVEIRNNVKISKKQDARNRQISKSKIQISNEISKSQKKECHSERIRRFGGGVEESYRRVSGSKDNSEDSLQNTQNDNEKSQNNSIDSSVPQNDSLLATNYSLLTKHDLEYLLNLKGKNNLEALYSEANVLRKERIKDFVCIHGIVEFSNYCKNNCLYCGIRRDANIRRYRMNTDEIYRAVKTAVDDEGYKLVVLQSGEDLSYSDEEMVKMIERIKKNIRVFIFISVGERSRDFYQKAFDVGASGSLFRFETSNPRLYEIMHPGHNLKSRLDSLEMQIKIGYYVASGGIIGLPGQTISDMAEDLLLVKKLGVPMLSSGPYISSKNNLLEKIKDQRSKIKKMEGNVNIDLLSTNYSLHTNSERLRLTLNYYAAARLMMPEIKIPVTTALETLDPESGRHKGLLAGANALMFNITPEKYRADYNLYDHKYIEREKVWQKYGLFKGEESYEMLEERLKI